MKTDKKIEKLYAKALAAHETFLAADAAYDDAAAIATKAIKFADIAYEIANKANIKANRAKKAHLSAVETGKLIWTKDL